MGSCHAVHLHIQDICCAVIVPVTDVLAYLFECLCAHMCTSVSAYACPAVLLGAACTFSFSPSCMQVCCFLDNLVPDAAITMGMVLLNEAATSKGDVGKRRSKY